MSFRRCPTRTLAASAALALALAWFASPVAAQDEDYPHGKFEADCTLCHQSDSWIPAEPTPKFDHRKQSGFALEGVHAQTACRSCHLSLDFTEADPDCVACHLDIHSGELGRDCDRCHSTRSFIDRSVMLRRHVATRFPLTGTHLSVDCADCHPPAPQGRFQYVNTPMECSACHLERYLATTDPNHPSEGFPTNCEFCHPPTTWRQARFNHALVTAACDACHLDDYQATTNPNHQTLGFPTTCQTCHRSTSWRPTTLGFDHDSRWFPIYSGRHAGTWSTCSECHPTASDFSDFTCLTCHPHNDESRTAAQHGEVGNYQYDSLRCYACHPRGRHE